MKRNKLMLPILAVIVGVAASAFTVVKNNSNNTRVAGTYWYTFTGSQTVSGRMDKTQYTSPSTTEPGCPQGLNECAVEVKNVTGTPPSDISSLSITFNSSTGMPDGGNNFETNAQKQ
ncbi:MAG: hypothetical protein EPN37_08780 [Chitinophagaceae bacterium]|nr:MAG: hypothetical protein EPN37_08780 [Chitinophagaceae bacterium]